METSLLMDTCLQAEGYLAKQTILSFRVDFLNLTCPNQMVVVHPLPTHGVYLLHDCLEHWELFVELTVGVHDTLIFFGGMLDIASCLHLRCHAA